jgi:hypothetical protein
VVPKSIPITFPMIISFFYFFVINIVIYLMNRWLLGKSAEDMHLSGTS